MPKPNIVFFMVDQLSAKWLENALKGTCPTPGIKKLRDQGVSFDNCFTSNPVCMPARASIATGLSTRGHGVLENGYYLNPKLPNFIKMMQESGWKTGAFGKVHFLPHFAGFYPDFKPYGFETTFITEDHRGGQWLDWIEKNHNEYYDTVLAQIWAYNVPEFSKYGPKKMNIRDRIKKARENFKFKTQDFPESTPFAHPLPFPAHISQTEWITEKALNFISDMKHDESFLAHISYVQPHSPFTPPKNYMSLVETKKIPEPIVPEWFKSENAPKYFADKKPAEVNWEHARQCYFADIAHLDSQLVKIFDALHAKELLNNTYIIFLADHGELLGDHGFYGKEERHYDACIRIPLTIMGPGLKKGLTVESFVQLEDICPTILDLVSIQPPSVPTMGSYLKDEQKKNIQNFYGESLVRFCKGEAVDIWRNNVYVESYNAIWSITVNDWARTIRNKDFRYTLYPNNSGEQLFDLNQDLDEKNNVVNDKGYFDVRQDMRDILMEKIIMQDFPKTTRELFAMGVH